MLRTLPLARLATVFLLCGLCGCLVPSTGDTGSIITGGGGGSPSGGGGAVSGGGATSPPVGGNCLEPVQAATWRAQVLQLVNQQRTNVGLNPLTRNGTLEAQADQYACEMITYDFFDHVNPVTGSTLPDRAGQFGYSYQTIGENLAAGQRSPQEVVDAWMNSDGHRANILHREFTEIGIGIREGGDYGIYWVQEFGRPR